MDALKSLKSLYPEQHKVGSGNLGWPRYAAFTLLFIFLKTIPGQDHTVEVMYGQFFYTC